MRNKLIELTLLKFGVKTEERRSEKQKISKKAGKLEKYKKGRKILKIHKKIVKRGHRPAK